MSEKFVFQDVPEEKSFRSCAARIKVVGVGGCGSNTVQRLVAAGLSNADFICVNTDRDHLELVDEQVRKIHLGNSGQGAGGDPKMARDLAEKSQEEISRSLEGADMVFIAAGMGKGTGTGASPTVAKIARELGILTLAVIYQPSEFEGSDRIETARQGLAEIRQYTDALIVVANDKVHDIIDQLLNERKSDVMPGQVHAQCDDIPDEEAYEILDRVIRDAVTGLVEIITGVGQVNVDFKDVYNVLKESGTAMIGVGEAEGEDLSLIHI